MAYVLVERPAGEPVSVDEARDYLRVDFADDDSTLSALIVAARMHFERQTQRSLISQRWRLDLEAFPWPHGRPHPHFASSLGFTGEPIRLAHGPVISVDSVKYIDFAGTLQTLIADADYITDLSGDVAQVAPPLYTPWPWAPRRFQAVQVGFTAGYGAADDVEQLAKQAILFMVAHWYANRSPVQVGDRAAAIEVPMSAQSIMDSYSIPILG